MKRERGYWRILRRLSQLIALSLFFFLFIKTDYSGSDTIDYAVNLLFRIDPLLAATTMLAARSFIALLAPALLILLLSFIFGRLFCGWLCPMGALLDLTGRLTVTKQSLRETISPKLPLLICFFLLIAAFFGVSLAGFVDPFSLLVRGMVQAVYPATYYLTDIFFSYTYHNLPDAINSVTEPLYALLQATVLPFQQRYYELVIVSGLLLFTVFALEFVQRRFFCRNICPLGGMLGLVSRFGLFTVNGGDDSCGGCRLCSTRCRMGAIDETRHISMSTCVVCMDCIVECPRQIIFTKVSPPQLVRLEQDKVSLSRREFLGTLSAGCTLPLFLGVGNSVAGKQQMLIRPPGSLIENEFLASCVRCGECIQVCITNGLQPVGLQLGLEGLFTPYLQTRGGYCEFNCTLCGQVCPTGAIQSLDQAEKHRTKIGHAFFDKNLCLPFAKNIPCIVCEEHCPTPEKAIKFNLVQVVTEKGETITLKQPYVVDELCIGCGICETKCPLPGRSAIIVNNMGEDRDPDNILPGGDGGGGGYYS